MIKRFFITGTDTDIGKTLATCALLQAIRQRGDSALGYKPVASGCEHTLYGLRNSDALALRAHSSLQLSYQQVNPLAFSEPTSPHIASREEGRLITLPHLSAGLRQLEPLADWILVEGAGGWYTPLAADLSFAEWVQAEALPVIMVVGIKLGCINHALLTARAIAAAGLPLAGWIANHPARHSHRPEEYLQTLQQQLPAPMIGRIPWQAEGLSAGLAEFIDLAPLMTV